MNERYKFHLDENFPPQVAAALRAIWPRHHFTTNDKLRLSGTRDLKLFPALAQTDHHAIITFDRRQLGDGIDLAERKSLVENGLHWIGIPMAPEGTKGARVFARATAILVAGLPHVLDDWRSDPHAYHTQPPRNVDSMIPDVEKL